jgi:hypothetical protein
MEKTCEARGNNKLEIKGANEINNTAKHASETTLLRAIRFMLIPLFIYTLITH